MGDEFFPDSVVHLTEFQYVKQEKIVVIRRIVRAFHAASIRTTLRDLFAWIITLQLPLEIIRPGLVQSEPFNQCCYLPGS